MLLMTTTVTSTRLKRETGDILDQVAAGEEVGIERNGKLVARLVPAAKGDQLRGLWKGHVTQNCTDEELMEPVMEPM